jgi:uncharacterized damage-inducible protein DinB
MSSPRHNLEMAVSADTLRLHLDYHAWASRRLLEVASSLPSEELNRDFQTSDRSILGTLVHIFASDRLWLARVSLSPIPQFISDADYHLPVLQTAWPNAFDGWRNWAADLTDDTVSAELAYTDLRGRHWTQRIWQLVFHVVNHGTHHRGQVSGFLRSLGRIPPPLDLHIYYREL